MSLISGYSEDVVISLFIMEVMGLASIIGTILTLWLIYSVGRKNGYTMIIVCMTSMQLMYDIAILITPMDIIGNETYAFQDALASLGGISTSLWSNVLSFVVYYVVKNFRALNIEKNFHWFALGIYVPSIALAISAGISHVVPDRNNTSSLLYLIVRIISIVINFALYYLVSRKIAFMGYNDLSSSGEGNDDASNHSGSTKRANNNAENPVYALSRRLKYYPIFQAISRIPFTWYQLAYGYGVNGTGFGFRPERNALLIISAFVTPSSGLAYFFIYLLMQPLAYAYFKASAYTCCCFLCSKKMTPEERQSLFRKSFVNAAAANRHPDEQFNGSSASVMTLLDDLDEEELAQRIEKMNNEQPNRLSSRMSSSIASRPSLFDSNDSNSNSAGSKNEGEKSIPMTSKI